MKFRNRHTGTVFVVTEVVPNPAPGMDFYYGHYEGEEPKEGADRTMYTAHELAHHWNAA